MADTNTVILAVGSYNAIMKELLGLIADVNPNEIAAHIADGNLADWCEALRQALTVSIENS